MTARGRAKFLINHRKKTCVSEECNLSYVIRSLRCNKGTVRCNPPALCAIISWRGISAAPPLDVSVSSRASIFNQRFRRLRRRNFFRRDIGSSGFLPPSVAGEYGKPEFNVRRAFTECADFPVRVYARVRTWKPEASRMGSLLLPRGIINGGSCECAPLDN